MMKPILVALAALSLGASGAVFAAGDDAGTHTAHTKQMKNAGVKDGDTMSNAAPAAPQAAPATDAAPAGGTHTVHSKPMKNAGVKDGDRMPNAAPATAQPATAKAPTGATHTVHTKQMKDAGVKDGDKMENKQ